MGKVCSPSGSLELVDLDFDQLDIVLLLLGKAVLKGGVVVGIHLVALQVNLEGRTLFNSFIPDVVEPFVADQLNGGGTEVRVEFQHGFKELKGFCRSSFEFLGQALSFNLILNLLCVDEPVLISQVRQVLFVALAQNFQNFYELIVFCNFCWSISFLKLQARRNWIAAGALEENSIFGNFPCLFHLVREIDTLAKNTPNTPKIGLLIVMALGQHDFRRSIPPGGHMRRELPRHLLPALPGHIKQL